MPHPSIPQAMSAVCHGNQGELNHLEPSWALTPRLCSGDRSCPVQAVGRGSAASLSSPWAGAAQRCCSFNQLRLSHVPLLVSSSPSLGPGCEGAKPPLIWL